MAKVKPDEYFPHKMRAALARGRLLCYNTGKAAHVPRRRADRKEESDHETEQYLLRRHRPADREVRGLFGQRTGDAYAVYEGVSYPTKQGEVTALVGPSCGGKTTVSRLAARFWDIDRGRITVGGMDISEIDPE